MKEITKGSIYCLKDSRASKKSLVMATGIMKLSIDTEGNHVEIFEAIPIASAYVNTFDGLNIQISPGEKKYYLPSYIEYECGTKTGKQRLADSMYHCLFNDGEELKYEIGSNVFFVNDADEIKVMQVKDYQFNSKKGQLELYIINPIDKYDFWILEERIWKNGSILNTSLDKIIKRRTDEQV